MQDAAEAGCVDGSDAASAAKEATAPRVKPGLDEAQLKALLALPAVAAAKVCARACVCGWLGSLACLLSGMTGDHTHPTTPPAYPPASSPAGAAH